MAKGLLKFMMLKMIQEKRSTGYDLIKQTEEMTGSRPSTGSVYPLLHTMVSDGWIKGEDKDDKTYYSITGLGRERLGALQDVRMDLMIRMHQGAFLTADIPDDEMHRAHMDHMDVLSALVQDISRLQAEGADHARINGILLKAQKELRKLGKVK